MRTLAWVLLAAPLWVGCEWDIDQRNLEAGQIHGFVDALVEPRDPATITSSSLTHVTLQQEHGEDMLLMTISFPMGIDALVDGETEGVEVSVVRRVNGEWRDEADPEAIEVSSVRTGQTSGREDRLDWRRELHRLDISVFWAGQKSLNTSLDYARRFSRQRPPPRNRSYAYDC